jgi:hypothetical protein
MPKSSRASRLVVLVDCVVPFFGLVKSCVCAPLSNGDASAQHRDMFVQDGNTARTASADVKCCGSHLTSIQQVTFYRFALCKRKSSQIIWNVHCPTRAPHRTIRDKHGQTFRLDRCRDNHVLVVTFLGTCSSLCPVDEEQSRLDLASADLALFSLRLATLSANFLWKKQSGRKPFQGCLKKSGRKPQNVSSKGCGSACEDVSLAVQNEQRMSILERWN